MMHGIHREHSLRRSHSQYRIYKSQLCLSNYPKALVAPIILIPWGDSFVFAQWPVYAKKPWHVLTVTLGNNDIRHGTQAIRSATLKCLINCKRQIYLFRPSIAARAPQLRRRANCASVVPRTYLRTRSSISGQSRHLPDLPYPLVVCQGSSASPRFTAENDFRVPVKESANNFRDNGLVCRS